MATGALAWDYPDAFKGALTNLDLTPVLTGSAYSSHAPASWWFHPVVIQEPVAAAYVNVYKSLNAAVPAATSQNSSGTYNYSYGHGISIFQRQDYGANSTNYTCIKTAMGGITAALTFSSGSQSFAMSWATDTTGGASTFSTTSGAGNWSSYLTGPKILGIPLGMALQKGEYWFAHQHSSTTAQTGSNVTIMSVSNLHIAPQVVTYGMLGSTVTLANGAPGDIGLGIASAVTTNASMPSTVVSASVANRWVQNLSAF